ncbi:MAG TPA: hypothetical protein VFF65_05895 [Phycisphaerales bacterium]|nr:hypothetical protein [Phycisphaerales bacterium]
MLADSAGTVTVSTTIDVRATSLAFGPRAAHSYPGVNGSAEAEFERRLADWSQTMAFPSDIRVRIPTGASTVHAVYQSPPGTTVKGFLKRAETGAVIKEASVWAEDWMAESDANLFSGRIHLGGIPKDQPVWLAANWGSRTSYRQLAPITGPHDMADWMLTAADISCPLSVTVPVVAGGSVEKAGTAISLVRADGQEVFTYFMRRRISSLASSNPDGLAQSSLQSPDMTPKIPAGVYYVYPDIWTNFEAPTAFIKRIRNGDTPPAAIPKFTVTTGQTVTGTVDFGAVQVAVVDWIRSSIEANAQSGQPPTP